ncbi:MAG: zinc ribbon domain-containing protein [Pirellulales bacterium]|nr:zinc ribbon domain-containing protein [Pirellulales bacterium]
MSLQVTTHKQEVMQHNNWKCLKCGNADFETSQFSATGGGLSKFFNVQNKKFTTMTCTRCMYTEIYKTSTSTLGNVLDFLGN